MFLLPSLLLGLVFALLLGGKPSRILDVRFRLSWTVVLALAVQVVLFTRLGEAVPGPLQRPLHLSTYALLILFALANLRLRPLIPVLLGMVSNAVAIAANGGSMPLSPSAAAAAGLPLDAGSNVSQSAGHLRFLGDVFAIPPELPLANAFSVGDILIGLGMAAFIVAVSLEGGGRSLDPRRMLEPFRMPAYRRLAGGRLISHLGDWLTLAALIGWVYEETSSTGQVALLMISRLAPPILGGGVAAVLVDRLPKSRLLVCIEIARGVAVAGALAGVLSGERSVIFAALAVSGALAAMSNAAVPALLPSMLPVEQLASANAGLGIAKDVSMALGAVGAGLSLSLVGVTAALLADLATFVAAALLYRGLRAVGAAMRSTRRANDPPGGLRYLVRRRTLTVLVLSFAAATLATGLTNASLPRFLEGHVGLGPGAYGFGLAALAIGLAAGQAIVGFARVGPAAGRWIGAALFLMSGLFVLLGLSDHAPTVFLVLAAIGFVDGTTDVVFDTVVQRETDPRYLGSVFGVSSAFITTTMMGAVAVSPLLNGLLDAHAVILGAAVVLVVAGSIALVGARGWRQAAPAPASAVSP